MSATSHPATSGGSGDQDCAPSRSHEANEQSRKSKRTLIESACTACQKRKSRCDGQRPACSRCQTLQTGCHYYAEEGESRWKALRRRNRTLERERDEAREILAQIQTRPEPEAHEIYERLRSDAHANDLGTLIYKFANALLSGPHRQQEHDNPASQQQHGKKCRRSLQHQLHVQPGQPQQPQQQVSPTTQQRTPFTQPNCFGKAPGPQLPPLRSVVGIPLPSASASVAQRPLSQPNPLGSKQRQISTGSGLSASSYSMSLSFDGHRGQ